MAGKSTFTDEMASLICEQIADGRSLRSICAQDDMPAASTVFLWLAQNEQFSEQYARAREVQADTLFDEILAIADDAANDFVTKTNPDGTTYEAVDHEHIQRSRLRVDARKWMAGKLRPKKYGERLAVDGEVKHEVADPLRVLMERIASEGRRIHDPVTVTEISKG